MKPLAILVTVLLAGTVLAAGRSAQDGARSICRGIVRGNALRIDARRQRAQAGFGTRDRCIPHVLSRRARTYRGSRDDRRIAGPPGSNAQARSIPRGVAAYRHDVRDGANAHAAAADPRRVPKGTSACDREGARGRIAPDPFTPAARRRGEDRRMGRDSWRTCGCSLRDSSNCRAPARATSSAPVPPATVTIRRTCHRGIDATSICADHR